MRNEPKKNILVAEDDPAIRLMLERLLSREFEVRLAPDGSNALAMASKCPIDLLLTDVMMPVLDGFRLAHQLRLLPGKERVPIIFLTAKDTPKEQLTAIKLGARHFIAKPFSARELLTRVRNLLS